MSQGGAGHLSIRFVWNPLAHSSVHGLATRYEKLRETEKTLLTPFAIHFDFGPLERLINYLSFLLVLFILQFFPALFAFSLLFLFLLLLFRDIRFNDFSPLKGVSKRLGERN